MTPHTRVLVVDAAGAEAADHRHLLGAAGHDTAHLADVGEALEHLERVGADVVLVSLAHAGLPGVARLARAGGGAPLVVIVHDAATRDAREALRLGAYDVVRRADAIDLLFFAVERAVQAGERRREVAMLRARLGDRAARALVGQSAAMETVRGLIARAAASRVTVLVSGEPGTGKDLVARIVHDLSERAGSPCLAVRCAGVDAVALEAELFGVAETARQRARPGLLEQARGGTLVLDGFLALPPAVRGRIAGAVAEGVTRRAESGVGERVPVDVRLILTAADGAGDDDLPRRLSVLPIALPPLRERRRDIPALVQHFRARLAGEARRELPPLPPELVRELVVRQWPGNVRELEHFVERAAYQSAMAAETGTGVFDERLTLEALERRYILHVLDRVDGHQSRAAEQLGIDRRTLYRKLKQYRDDGVVLRNAI